MLLPDVEPTLADPQASADLGHLLPALHPLQGSNDLLFRVRFVRHLPLSSIGIPEGPIAQDYSSFAWFSLWVVDQKMMLISSAHAFS